jgi:hypothetical protein
MKAKIKYLWGKDHLLIDLGNRIEPRIRVIYWLEFTVSIGIAVIFLLQSYQLHGNVLHFLSSICIGVLALLAVYRFFSRMFYREKLIVTDRQFILVRKTPFSSIHRSYDWEEMGPLHYLGKEAKTDHPLKGKCFDYFGFDTQEQLVQDLHHDGNLYFEYRGLSVRFARGIYSWNAEEIIRMIQLFSGTALQLGSEWKNLMEEMRWED